ncbi:MAG TPA: MFS transporter [Anaeromyxobacter sp.]
MSAAPRSPAPSFLVGGEALERFSYYGVTSALVLYLNEHLLYPERDAKAHYHAFLAAAWLAPLVGAWLADRLRVRYRATLGVVVAWASVLGLAVLAAFESRAGLAVGLALVVLGAGATKPSISGFVGDPLRAGDGPARARANGWLAGAVNGAAVLAALLVPALLVAFGPRVAFAVPAGALALARVVLRAGRARPVLPAPARRDPHGFLRVVARALSRLGTGHPGQHWLDLARDVHPPEAVEGAKAVLRIGAVFAAVTLFWALFDQKGSAWVFQARQMDLAIAGRQLSPAQLQAASPLLAVVLVPLLGAVVFPALARRGVAPSPLARMSAGMFAAVLSFAAAAIVQTLVDAGHAPHALWQLPQYLLLAVGEVLVSVTGLELSFTQAPRTMRSTVMSIWFLTVFGGNLLTALVGQLVRLEGAAWFWFFAAVMLAGTLVFRAIARVWRVARAEEIVAE